MLKRYMDRLPLVAILRGITPAEAADVGRALAAEGFAIVEVPLNSPRPLDSIERLAGALGPDVLVGAGTVLRPSAVAEVASSGGRLIVMPHADVAVIKEAKSRGLACAPGVATPTEGFAALAAGADALKLFPAEMLNPAVVRAFRSVFPKETAFLPVGGITPETMGPFVEAGAAGFGLGSALYKPGFSAAEVGERARAFVSAWRHIAGGH